MAASEPLGTKVEHYIPKVRNLPETKPIYDNVRQIKNMEKVAACVQQSKSCNCYTDQGIRLYIDDMVCKAYIKDGIFDRYSDLSQR